MLSESSVPERQDAGSVSRSSGVLEGRTSQLNPEAVKSPEFLARFLLMRSNSDPLALTKTTKWIITSIAAFAAATAPMSASIVYPAISDMSEHFQVSPTVINLSVAVYLVASSILPLWWSAWSEVMGRRFILILSFFLNIPLTFACGLSPNVAFLTAFRLLSGSASASGQTVGAGVIADIWKAEDRALAMSIFYLGPLVGPLFLPLIGGILTEKFGWQSIMWFLAAQGALIFVLIVIGLPETIPPKRRAADLVTNHSTVTRPESTTDGSRNTVSFSFPRGDQILKPFMAVAFLRFPPVIISVFMASLAFGSCFVLNISLEVAYSISPYDYSPTTVGLLFLPSSLGCIVASVFAGSWVDRIMIRGAEKAERYDEQGNLVYLPEDRLGVNAWVSLVLYPLGLIMYGWTIQKGINWIVPSIAGCIFGLGVMMVFSATTTMAAEFIPHKSSSGVAVNNFARNLFSCVGTIVARPLIEAMGHGWLFTMIGLFAWSTGYLGVFLLKRYGRSWRAKMGRSTWE